MRFVRHYKISTALLALSLSVIVAHYLQPSFLYFPRRYEIDEYDASRNQLRRRGLDLLKIQYGLNMYSYLVVPRSSTNVTLYILIGGNGMTALDWTDWVTGLVPLMEAEKPNAAFLLIDYPGYGNNPGNPSPETINECIHKSFAKTLEVLEIDEINVLGHSIGAAAAAKWVVEMEGHRITRLVLSAPFTSVSDMTKVIFPILPHFLSSIVSRHNWDNRQSLKTITNKENVGDVIIVHGETDEIVPWAMGRELSQVANCRFVSVPSTQHNEILAHQQLFAYVLTSAPESFRNSSKL